MSKTLRNGASFSVGAVLLFGSICLLSTPSAIEGQEKKDAVVDVEVGSIGIGLCLRQLLNQKLHRLNAVEFVEDLAHDPNPL